MYTTPQHHAANIPNPAVIWNRTGARYNNAIISDMTVLAAPNHNANSVLLQFLESFCTEHSGTWDTDPSVSTESTEVLQYTIVPAVKAKLNALSKVQSVAVWLASNQFVASRTLTIKQPAEEKKMLLIPLALRSDSPGSDPTATVAPLSIEGTPTNHNIMDKAIYQIMQIRENQSDT
jgi:hypothetical protein